MTDTPCKKLQALLDTAPTGGICPGAVLAIVMPGQETRFFTSGNLMFAEGEPFSENCIFDMASITKVIATTTIAMLLVDKGILDLDKPVVDFLPDAFPDSHYRNAVTPRMLMAHCSGLPAGAQFFIKYETMDGIEEKKRIVRSTALVSQPKSATVYSDIGMMIMAQIIESLAGKQLDVLSKELIFKPLGMPYTSFCPVAMPGCHFVPTEEIAGNPGHYWTGIVHDENARWLGGVAGHAGLFSTAGDLGIFATMMLCNGKANGKQFICPATIAAFTTKAGLQPDSSRCLGWDGLSNGCAGGLYASPESYGHTGYTGTSIWMDKPQNIAAILLTNAVHPHRACKQNGYFKWRNTVHTCAYGLLGQNPNSSRE